MTSGLYSVVTQTPHSTYKTMQTDGTPISNQFPDTPMVGYLKQVYSLRETLWRPEQ